MGLVVAAAAQVGPLVAGVCDPGGRPSDRTGLTEAGYNKIGRPPRRLANLKSHLS